MGEEEDNDRSNGLWGCLFFPAIGGWMFVIGGIQGLVWLLQWLWESITGAHVNVAVTWPAIAGAVDAVEMVAALLSFAFLPVVLVVWIALVFRAAFVSDRTKPLRLIAEAIAILLIAEACIDLIFHKVLQAGWGWYWGDIGLPMWSVLGILGGIALGARRLLIRS